MDGSAQTMKNIIVDLDGTLANIEHRVKYVSTSNKNWEAFHAAIPKDTVYPHIYNLVMMYFEKDYNVTFLTGRNATIANLAATKKWLDNCGDIGKYPYTLLMRKSQDWRPDTVVKLELAKKHKLTPDNVELCLDDRNAVVAMWRANGYKCLQVADGNF